MSGRTRDGQRKPGDTPEATLTHGRKGDLHRAAHLILLAYLAALTVAVAAKSAPNAGPPVAWVEGALCVHAGWHYTHVRQHGRPEYVLWGHGYWRMWDVPDGLAGGSGEGNWDAANYGYGGGMQMDSVFQSNYGNEFLARYGPAGQWPVEVQLAVAYRGWLRQGWGAWPNTSRACGLR